MAKIRVIIKEPGKGAYEAYINNTLEDLQKTVDGYIETFTFALDAAIICDEEGKLKDKPYNFTMFGQDFFGTIIIAGVHEDSFCDFAPTAEEISKIFSWKEKPNGK